MIRELNDSDLQQVIDLLQLSPAFNLYLLGNLETLGLDDPICQFWGDFDETGSVRAVLNRYMTGWTLFGLPSSDWLALAGIIDAHPVPATRLQDNPGGIPSLLPYLKRYACEQVHVEEVMTLKAADFHPRKVRAGVTIRRAHLADLPALVELYADAGHMSRSASAVERPLRDTRLWLAVRNRQIVASALTNAETSDLAMIGGVFTPPEYRERGLSQAVCSALCADLLADGKQPVLYWETPAAGAVYRKLGFSAVGQWRSVWLIKK